MRVRGVLREEVWRYSPRALALWRRGRRAGYPKGTRFAYHRDRRAGAYHFAEATVAAALTAEGGDCWSSSYRLFSRASGRSWKAAHSAGIRRQLLQDDLPDPHDLARRVDFRLADPAIVCRNAASRRWTFCAVVRDRSAFDPERLRSLCLLRAVYRAGVRLVRVIPDAWPAPPRTEHVVDLDLDAAGLWWTTGPVASDREHFELAFGSMVGDEPIVPVVRVGRRPSEGGAPFVVDVLPLRGRGVRWETKARASVMADLEAHLLGAHDGAGWAQARSYCESPENFAALVHWTYHPARVDPQTGREGSAAASGPAVAVDEIGNRGRRSRDGCGTSGTPGRGCPPRQATSPRR